jgi:hypothetical protein
MQGNSIKEARRKGQVLIKRAMKDALSDLNIDSDHIDVELENNVQYIHSGTSELEVSAIIIC